MMCSGFMVVYKFCRIAMYGGSAAIGQLEDVLLSSRQFKDVLGSR